MILGSILELVLGITLSVVLVRLFGPHPPSQISNVVAASFGTGISSGVRSLIKDGWTPPPQPDKTGSMNWGYILELVLRMILSVVLIRLFGSDPSGVITYAAAFSFGGGILPAVRSFIKDGCKFPTHDDTRSGFYDLDHYKLNLRPLTEAGVTQKGESSALWMNMGYWKDTKDFQTASESLLLQLLKFAGLRSPDETPSNHRHHNLDVLDLGYGCGDQILALLHAQSPFRLPGGPVSSFRLNKYVGITFNQSHCDIAGQRVGQRISHRGLEADVQLFCGDAANPDGWSRTLLGEAESLRNRATERNDGLLVPGTETWVLALDSMYHFSPSRLPVLKYARQTLDASLMTFDLVLADDVSSLSRLALSMVAKMLGCPFGAFMPVREYREMLRTAGYEDDKIQIQDISEHVFEPLSQFIERQTVVLQKVGINIGKFALAKHLFRWWANSGSVRGMMVVARTSEQNKDEDVVI